jgi:hypothetical protein
LEDVTNQDFKERERARPPPPPMANGWQYCGRLDIMDIMRWPSGHPADRARAGEGEVDRGARGLAASSRACVRGFKGEWIFPIPDILAAQPFGVCSPWFLCFCLVPLLRSPVPLFVPLWFPYAFELGAGLGKGRGLPFLCCLCRQKKTPPFRAGFGGFSVP